MKPPRIVIDPDAARESYRRLTTLLHQLRLQVHDLEEIIAEFERILGGEKKDGTAF